MTDLEITKLCAEAMGWTHLGAVGVVLTEGTRASEADKLYPGKLWCLSGGNDWWKDPNGFTICAHCQSIPDPLHDDAQAMALVKRFRMTILHIWVRGPYYLATVEERSQKVIADARNEDLNRAICECVAHMQKAKSQS